MRSRMTRSSRRWRTSLEIRLQGRRWKRTRRLSKRSVRGWTKGKSYRQPPVPPREVHRLRVLLCLSMPFFQSLSKFEGRECSQPGCRIPRGRGEPIQGLRRHRLWLQMPPRHPPLSQPCPRSDPSSSRPDRHRVRRSVRGRPLDSAIRSTAGTISGQRMRPKRHPQGIRLGSLSQFWLTWQSTREATVNDLLCDIRSL